MDRWTTGLVTSRLVTNSLDLDHRDFYTCRDLCNLWLLTLCGGHDAKGDRELAKFPRRQIDVPFCTDGDGSTDRLVILWVIQSERLVCMNCNAPPSYWVPAYHLNDAGIQARLLCFSTFCFVFFWVTKSLGEGEASPTPRDRAYSIPIYQNLQRNL